ncbi:hypothetical protein BDB00DRAFT_784391 [Zychaea mexicana]|uniref:uncharacterized protein n=1 Tax=Zychaea mexicana TaxID=64656 RepID=UPI0022FEE148|nr:uncharacterized protein BDB00DRAFT_784391 [Zychaea mexicana]KAI9497875.1 hypothetical protein BDB00DRAFT_784391 [Zychaea mexicana]
MVIVVPAISDNPGFDDEQTLKREVYHLQQSIPQIEADIDRYLIAQKELHDARESIAKAMMLLPGASAFVNRQTMVSYGMNSSSSSETLDGLYPSKMALDPSVAATQDATKLAQDANEHLIHASDSCDQVPLLTIPSFGKDDNVASALSAYRDCKMQIETLLRTKINPRYSQLQSQIAMSRIHFEQKTIEWVDKQITMLERVLRENGALKNVSLDREMGVLRMGSNAAMIAVAAEASGRVTVDDVLEVDSSTAEVERNGPLPVYSEDGGEGNIDDGITTDQRYRDAMMADQHGESSSSQQRQQQPHTNHLDNNSSGSNSASQLPAYSSHNHHQNDGSSFMTAAAYDEHDQPPAYSTN